MATTTKICGYCEQTISPEETPVSVRKGATRFTQNARTVFKLKPTICGHVFHENCMKSMIEKAHTITEAILCKSCAEDDNSEANANLSIALRGKKIKPVIPQQLIQSPQSTPLKPTSRPLPTPPPKKKEETLSPQPNQSVKPPLSTSLQYRLKQITKPKEVTPPPSSPISFASEKEKPNDVLLQSPLQQNILTPTSSPKRKLPLSPQESMDSVITAFARLTIGAVGSESLHIIGEDVSGFARPILYGACGILGMEIASLFFRHFDSEFSLMKNDIHVTRKEDKDSSTEEIECKRNVSAALRLMVYAMTIFAMLSILAETETSNA